MNFWEQLINYQRQLISEPNIEDLPERIINIIRDCMTAENVAVVGVEGETLGNWWVRSGSSKFSAHSMDTIKKAISSERGFWRGGVAEDPSKASDSQKQGNIRSCLAAKIVLGAQTLGAIYCDVRTGERCFGDEDGERLKLLADIFSIHIKHFGFNQQDPQEPKGANSFPTFLGETLAAKQLKADLSDAARLSTPVLILGESGVGKEVAAYLIHTNSPRASGPFLPIHCAAISRDLFESELFGHEKGAFSGAFRKHRGRMELANGGTLFLDEVGDIPLEFQVKLLRALESKRIWPVGSEAELGPLDFRLICSTNRPLMQMVSEKTFRDDLFYRISGMQIEVPSLRERIQDIPLLASYFAYQGSNPKRIEDNALNLLQSISWPGNVRQLRTVLENARDLTAGPVITKEAIEKQLSYQVRTPQARENSTAPAPTITFDEIQRRWDLGELDAQQLEEILVPLYLSCKKNLSAVARRLQCRDVQQLREFRNFIYYRRKTGVINLPE